MTHQPSFLHRFILVLWISALAFGNASIPQSLIDYMATRNMRYHHYIWHNVRENWNRFTEETQQAFRDIDWEPPRAARNFDYDGRSSMIYDNFSGEDFLFMHRNMIDMANDFLAVNEPSFGKLTGWINIPAPGDADYPVPAPYSGSPQSLTSLTNWKSDSFYETSIVGAENRFKNPSQLRRWSLGEFGARLEGTIHSWMHMRWSDSNPVGYRGSGRGTIPFMNRRYDNVTYNWLADSYSSHVNPIFWKMHCWIEDRIEDWRVANGLSSIRWTGTWIGGPMSSLASVMKHSSLRAGDSKKGDPDTLGDVFEKAFDILCKSGVPEFTFADDAERVFKSSSSPKTVRAKACKTKVRKVL